MSNNDPGFVPYDFKLRDCLDYASNDWNIHRKPKTDGLKPISDFFRGRCARLRLLMQLPANISDLAMELQHAIDQAQFEVLGKVSANHHVPINNHVELARRWREILDEKAEERNRMRDTPEWDEHVKKALRDALLPVNIMTADPRTARGIEASLMSYITTTWTIIETLFGDLWETSLNLHPSRLANLPGLRSTRDRGGDSKSVRLDSISQHGFDLRSKMGTILRGKFDFAGLEGIREAYLAAFEKSNAQIEKALSNKALDTLSAVRNVIVHRDGRADAEYIKRTKFLPALPKVEAGRPIWFNGEMVVDLMKPALISANQLLVAVDDWHVKATT